MDFSELGFLGSGGLTVLVEYHDHLIAAGSALRVAAAARHVTRPIQLTGLDEQIPLLPTVAEALAADTPPALRASGHR